MGIFEDAAAGSAQHISAISALMMTEDSAEERSISRRVIFPCRTSTPADSNRFMDT